MFYQQNAITAVPCDPVGNRLTLQLKRVRITHGTKPIDFHRFQGCGHAPSGQAVEQT
jgi:hypothetical protein